MAVCFFLRKVAVKILTTYDNSVAAIEPQESRCSAANWQQLMKSAIRSTEKLLSAVGLDHLDDENLFSPRSAEQFPVFVPIPFLNRMEKGNFNDPLLRQVLPIASEEESPAHFSTDPLGEQDATLRDGVLQKYQRRILVIASSACAINCRYCFRRHFPYETAAIGDSRWEKTIEQIASDPSVAEVILSGGDPLVVTDEKLALIVQRIAEVPHVVRLRIHSRLPIVIPQRVTPSLLELLQEFNQSRSGRQSIFVVHCNHANEIDGDVQHSLQRLSSACTQLLNQSVLLAGVNDDEDALVQLSERLMASSVLPYYLHQLDPIMGAAHFEVDVEKGRRLIAAMRAQLPGFGVPRYVQEIAAEPNKTVLA